MQTATDVNYRKKPEARGADDAELRQRLAAAEAERRRAQAAMVDLEERLSDAINVCVALERLHGSTDHGEVLRAIQDVVINLVGSEELAVYEPGASGELEVVQSFGLAGSRLAPVTPGHGPIGRVAAEGRAWVAGDATPCGDPDLTACVPLVADDRVVAVLAIWRLLPHKPALREGDRRVLELLGPHAGRALYLTAGNTRRARAA
ncbi:MAG TPA: GAF domain-containing protein [Anaeromyxobacter sp.]|nr:GAF domain-containing protein [Anaeromyxobacter sp.]